MDFSGRVTGGVAANSVKLAEATPKVKISLSVISSGGLTDLSGLTLIS